MKFAAFFRNVNLGQPGSPTRDQIETAFLQAGAGDAASLLSNGTLVFTDTSLQAARLRSKRAGEILTRACGLDEPAFVCSLRRLANFVAEDPFGEFKDPTIQERCISFFEPATGRKASPALESESGNCVIFRLEAGVAFSVTYEIASRTGYPAPVLEKALNTPVTTRSWTTILRLVAKHA